MRAQRASIIQELPRQSLLIRGAFDNKASREDDTAQDTRQSTRLRLGRL